MEDIKSNLRNWEQKVGDVDFYFEEKGSQDPLYLYSFVATMGAAQLAGHVFKDEIVYSQISVSITTEDPATSTMIFVEMLATVTQTLTQTTETYIKTIETETKKRKDRKKAYQEKH